MAWKKLEVGGVLRYKIYVCVYRGKHMQQLFEVDKTEVVCRIQW